MPVSTEDVMMITSSAHDAGRFSCFIHGFVEPFEECLTVSLHSCH